MKKFGVLLLTTAMVLSLAACGETPADSESASSAENTESTESVESTDAEESTEEATEEATEESTEEATEEVTDESTEEATEEVVEEASDVMSYADYAAADLDADVVVEAYVQAKQSWWDDKATVYAQDEDGAYFLYNMACSEEDYAKLTEGTKIKVTGFKSEWAGEVEIVDATFEVVDGADSFVAKPVDVTDLLGTDALIEKQNQKVSFTDMTVVSVAYKNDTPGDDIYVTLSKDGANYDFCLEYYLNGSDEDFYALVGGLEADQVVDVEGFLYWYEGVNTHITAVTVK